MNITEAIKFLEQNSLQNVYLGSTSPENNKIGIKKVKFAIKTIKNTIKNNVSKKVIEEAVYTMVLSINAPDDILIQCQNYLYKELKI